MMQTNCLKVVMGMVLVCGAAAVSPAGDCENFEPISLRLVTLNVREGIGSPASFAFQSTGDFLTTNDVDGPGPNSGLNPDIVALQECRDDANLTAYRDQYLPGFSYHRTVAIDAGGNFNAFFVSPDLTVLDVDEVNVGTPRRLIRITVEVPEADNLLTLYNHHFKAFTDQESSSQRETQAELSGIRLYSDRVDGLDLDDDNTRETPNGYSVFMGDLNSNNNFDGTLNGLFIHDTLDVPTGIENIPVESLAGRNSGGSPVIGTFGSSRLDYICVDSVLVQLFHDTNGSGSYPIPPTLPGAADQAEINMMGFVYKSNEDGGQMSNGDSSATSFASDHSPLVLDLLLPRDVLSVLPCTGDTDRSGAVDIGDLNAVIGNFGVTGGSGCDPGDVTGDGNVDINDLNTVLGNFGLICP